MLSFKHFAEDLDTRSLPKLYCNSGGPPQDPNGYFSTYLIKPFLSAGGPPQKQQRLVKESYPSIIHQNGILHDPAADNTSIRQHDHRNLIVAPHHTSHVHPHLTDLHAKHYAALVNNTESTHPNYNRIVSRYTHSSDSLNQVLHIHDVNNKPVPRVVQGIHINELDDLIAQHSLPHAMTVYSGTHFHPGKYNKSHLPAYTSTSLSPHVSKDFGDVTKVYADDGEIENHTHILRIPLPKGFPHLFTDHNSRYQGQSELILPRQVKLHLSDHPSHIVRGHFNSHFDNKPNPERQKIHFWDAKISL